MQEQVVLKPMQWTSIKLIEEVPPISDQDYQCLKEVRDVLARFGAIERFGVHLIHRHFDVAEDEVLVEYTDKDNRTLLSKVERRADLPQDEAKIETQWCFDRDQATVICHGYCFVDRGHTRRHQQV